MKSFWLWLVISSMVALRIIFYFLTPVKYLDGTQVVIHATVLEEPKYYGNKELLDVYGFRFYLPASLKVEYGDYVVVAGTIHSNKLDETELIEHSKSTNPLFTVRRRLLSFYKMNLPKDESALVSGMVLGSGELIGREFWEMLTKTSTAHVVVASGMNVSLVAGFLLFPLLGILSRKKAVVLSILGIWIYVVFAGLNAAIVRAGVMGTLFLFSQIFGKQAHMIRLLIFTGLIMLLVRPDWIVDLGFLLSFGATLSLILFATKVERLLHFVPKVLRGDLATSLAAQIFVAPILLFSFGYFNLFSPIVNMVVLWTVPAITVLGMVAGSLSLFYQPLARLILLIEYPLTKYFVFIVSVFSNSPLF